jgi:hypothetical protein
MPAGQWPLLHRTILPYIGRLGSVLIGSCERQHDQHPYKQATRIKVKEDIKRVSNPRRACKGTAAAQGTAATSA